MVVSQSEASLQLQHRQQIYDTARLLADSNTNVCASIVPMQDNLDELRRLFYRAVNHNVYPLIGELEEAGYCTGAVYERQKISDEQLADFKTWIKDKFSWDYQVPTCPATFGAIHIDNRNHITIDCHTGAGCHWFNMSNPEPFDLGDFRNRDYRKIANEILDYRLSRIDEVRQSISGYPDLVFGGCGGNAQPLLQQYIASYDAWQASQNR